MATGIRQVGRRNMNANNAVTERDTMSVGVRATSNALPRRYVLDVPSSRSRSSRPTRTARATEEYEETNERVGTTGVTSYSTYSTTNIENENMGGYSRSGSREYYYRDSENRDTDNATIKKLLESATTTTTTYTNAISEDQEVQALTAKATPEIKNYPINVDTNPELVVRPNTQRLTYTQDIAVRYLKPSTPPPPGPIIIREIRAPPLPAAPPIILRQRPPPPRTPSPIIIREKPPTRPKSVPTTVIKKVIPPPPPPPRKLIIERLPALPPKPRPVIIERWLPYHKQKRQVIHEKAKPLEPMSRVKNTIIEWRPPEVEVVKHVKKLGVQQADPQRYYTQHGDKLYTTEFVYRKLTELGLQEELALMQEQQTSAAKEEVAIEQADDYNVRQVLNSYEQSSKQSYTTGTNGTVMRLVRSASHSGVVDEYGEEPVLYERSPNNSSAVVYNSNTYNFDEYSSGAPVLTEEMLLRSIPTNGGKFPSHLLTKLGSQIYEMPPDQVDFSNNNRNRRTMTTTRYYTVNQGETGYESAGDEMGDAASGYGEEKYVRIKASDLKNVLENYDVYSNTGEKLEGEQINL